MDYLTINKIYQKYFYINYVYLKSLVFRQFVDVFKSNVKVLCISSILFVYYFSLCIYLHQQKQIKIMKTLNSTLTAKEIRNLNLNKNDVMGLEFLWENGVENNYLTINGENVVSFTNSKDRRKSFDKIKRMGLALGWKAPLLTDEEKGIIQAHKNGENPFAYSIICADPKRNNIVR